MEELFFIAWFGIYLNGNGDKGYTISRIDWFCVVIVQNSVLIRLPICCFILLVSNHLISSASLVNLDPKRLSIILLLENTWSVFSSLETNAYKVTM